MLNLWIMMIYLDMFWKYISEIQACKTFTITSSGGAKKSQAMRLGTYIKEIGLTNGRVAYYNRKNRQYLYWMNGFWLVSILYIPYLKIKTL